MRRFSRRDDLPVMNPKILELAAWRFKQPKFQNGSILSNSSRDKTDARFNGRMYGLHNVKFDYIVRMKDWMRPQVVT